MSHYYKILKPIKSEALKGAYTGVSGYSWIEVENSKWSEESVVYWPGRIAKPILTGSKLFVFDGEDNARSFLSSLSEPALELWLAECGPTEPMPVVSAFIAPDHLRYFWFKDRLWAMDAPQGSLVTPWLKPIERIYTPRFLEEFDA